MKMHSGFTVVLRQSNWLTALAFSLYSLTAQAQQPKPDTAPAPSKDGANDDESGGPRPGHKELLDRARQAQSKGWLALAGRLFGELYDQTRQSVYLLDAADAFMALGTASARQSALSSVRRALSLSLSDAERARARALMAKLEPRNPPSLTAAKPEQPRQPAAPPSAPPAVPPSEPAEGESAKAVADTGYPRARSGVALRAGFGGWIDEGRNDGDFMPLFASALVGRIGIQISEIDLIYAESALPSIETRGVGAFVSFTNTFAIGFDTTDHLHLAFGPSFDLALIFPAPGFNARIAYVIGCDAFSKEGPRRGWSLGLNTHASFYYVDLADVELDFTAINWTLDAGYEWF